MSALTPVNNDAARESGTSSAVAKQLDRKSTRSAYKAFQQFKQDTHTPSFGLTPLWHKDCQLIKPLFHRLSPASVISESGPEKKQAKSS